MKIDISNDIVKFVERDKKEYVILYHRDKVHEICICEHLPMITEIFNVKFCGLCGLPLRPKIFYCTNRRPG